MGREKGKVHAPLKALNANTQETNKEIQELKTKLAKVDQIIYTYKLYIYKILSSSL